MVQHKTVLELLEKLQLPIYASQFVHDIINYPNFIYPIESAKCGKKEKKLQQFEYFEKKGLSRWNKMFFIVFERLSLGGKVNNNRQKCLKDSW